MKWNDLNQFLLYVFFFFENKEQLCEREKIPEQMLQPVPDEITIITMFLDLGFFKKGEEMLSYHSPYKYRRWMRIFSRIVNPVVAYMEREDDVKYFRYVKLFMLCIADI